MSGSPVISFKWFKDEMEISSSPKYTMALADLVSSLEIVNCTVEDSGDYVCVASSEAGTDRCSSTVTVKGWFSLGFQMLLLALKYYLSFHQASSYVILPVQCNVLSIVFFQSRHCLCVAWSPKMW